MNDSKDVAAVLACAALEDALKKYAVANGLQIEDKDMSEVINAIKAVGSLNKTQATLLKGFTQVRNRAFHAEWDKFESADVKSVIGFVEQFIVEHF